jgi:hypothetical protein
MQIIIHRVNTLEKLSKVSTEFGIEIDIRGYGNKLYLSHDPLDNHLDYCELETLLNAYQHKIIVFNVKEAGYEQKIIDCAKKYNIDNYFFLDVEFPYFYNATRKLNFKKIAIRFSEAEPIENVLAQVTKNTPLCDWVWIDTNTMLPLVTNSVQQLQNFKTCLVCPERWGRPEDIKPYRKKLEDINFKLDAVMTSLECVEYWN